MKSATKNQREVLWAMSPLAPTEMTTSEITVRVNKASRFTTARPSIADRLRALEKKGMVEVTSDLPPRRWKITHAGQHELSEEQG